MRAPSVVDVEFFGASGVDGGWVGEFRGVKASGDEGDEDGGARGHGGGARAVLDCDGGGGDAEEAEGGGCEAEAFQCVFLQLLKGFRGVGSSEFLNGKPVGLVVV